VNQKDNSEKLLKSRLKSIKRIGIVGLATTIALSFSTVTNVFSEVTPRIVYSDIVFMSVTSLLFTYRRTLSAGKASASISTVNG